MEPTNTRANMVAFLVDALAIQRGELTEDEAVERAMVRMEAQRSAQPHWLAPYRSRRDGWY